MWANGLALEGVLDAAGDVDADAVEDAVAEIAARLLGALPPPVHHADLGPKYAVHQRSSSWGAMFKDRR